MAFASTPGGFSSPRNTVSRSLPPSRAHGAEFFAVASGVQVPYVGGDEFVVRESLSLERPSTYMTDDYEPSRLAYPSAVSTAITQINANHFIGQIRTEIESPRDEKTEKLLQVLSRNPHAASDKSTREISRKYLKKISHGLSFSDDVIFSRAPHTVPYDELKAQEVFKSGNVVVSKGKDTKDAGLIGRHDPRGTIKRHMPCHLKGPRRLKPLKPLSIPGEQMRLRDARALSQVDLGQLPKIDPTDMRVPKAVSKHEWDEHVLASISKSTAEWIIKEHLSVQDKERLGGFLNKRYKPVEDSKADAPERKDSKTQVRVEMKGKRKDIKKEDNTELHFTPSFVLPSRVGDKKLDTQNIYQQELLGGAQHIASKKVKDQNTIVLDTNDKIKFKKHLQDNFPQGAISWYPSEMKQHMSSTSQIGRQKKGLQRWKGLPSVVQDDAYLSTTTSTSDINISDLSAGYKLRKKMKEDINVVKIAEEWRSKWFLERKWQNSTTEELLKAMSDINDHVRLAAVAACSKAAMIRKTKREEPVLPAGIILDKHKETDISLQATLEPELLDKVTSLLQDKNAQVRIASAITLYTLKKTSDKAEAVLLWAIDHGGPPEKWAATQCLAMAGTAYDQVINELVRQLHSDNCVRAVEAGGSLADLSRHSGIVQSLIAELLNSSSWKDRATACKVIPKLKGGINKDMTSKLSYLMWNDWNKEVRTAAAQALGKTGNGKLVHDSLQERIMTGNERVKVDALKKLSNLGIMTVRLLPALVECFKSEYVSVRIEAAMAVGQLKITDGKIQRELLNVVSNDRSWKVKAHAIKALGCSGVVNDEVTDVLLWAMRYEKVAAVRAEACNAVAQLRIRDERILSVLQDRLVVESDDLVKREAIFTLQCLGVEPTGDVEMIEAIRKEVRRLCTRDVVVAHILDEDNMEAYTADYNRLFTTSDTDQLPVLEQRGLSREKALSSRATMTSRAASQASQRGWDPILAGYQAREIMSRAPTPGGLHMEYSYLPMDLNSASSENSSVIALDDEEFSDDDAISNHDDIDNSNNTTDQQNVELSGETKTLKLTGEFPDQLRTQSKGESKMNGARGRESALSEHAHVEDDLSSDVDSSKEDPELLELADEISEQQSVSLPPSEHEYQDE